MINVIYYNMIQYNIILYTLMYHKVETVRTSSETHVDSITDLRRVTMMVLEQTSLAVEKSQANSGMLGVLQGSVDAGFGRVGELLTSGTGRLPRDISQIGSDALDAGLGGGPGGGAGGGFSEGRPPQVDGGGRSRPSTPRGGGGQWMTQGGDGSRNERQISRRSTNASLPGGSGALQRGSSRYGQQGMNG